MCQTGVWRKNLQTRGDSQKAPRLPRSTQTALGWWQHRTGGQEEGKVWFGWARARGALGHCQRVCVHRHRPCASVVTRTGPDTAVQGRWTAKKLPEFPRRERGGKGGEKGLDSEQM